MTLNKFIMVVMGSMEKSLRVVSDPTKCDKEKRTGNRDRMECNKAGRSTRSSGTGGTNSDKLGQFSKFPCTS